MASQRQGRAKVSGTVKVEGYADVTWLQEMAAGRLFPAATPTLRSSLALGETAGKFSYSLDTTAFPDGDHALRLRVVDADSNYDEVTRQGDRRQYCRCAG